MKGDRFDVGRDNGKRRQGGCADGETLADGCGGVAQLVQSIGNLTNFLTQACHLSDTARVVRDRPIGINRHGDADRCQHPDCGDTHPIESGKPARDEDDDAQHEHRHHHRLHSY